MACGKRRHTSNVVPCALSPRTPINIRPRTHMLSVYPLPRPMPHRDMMTLAEASKIARRATSPSRAAELIVEKVYYRCLAKYERLKDDTT